jgi:hypothetical protein
MGGRAMTDNLDNLQIFDERANFVPLDESVQARLSPPSPARLVCLPRASLSGQIGSKLRGVTLAALVRTIPVLISSRRV